MISMEECYLIVTPSSLGDVIHAFPAVSLLAKHKLQAKIDRVVVSAFAGRIYPENNCHRAIPTEQAICSFLAEVSA